MAAPNFLLIKGNYAFVDQSFKSSILINKTVVIRNGKNLFLMTMMKREIINGEDLELWTTGYRQIHKIKQNIFIWNVLQLIFVVNVKTLDFLQIS